jgi:hypothetical protein
VRLLGNRILASCVAWALAVTLGAGASRAQPAAPVNRLADSGRLLLTQGVSTVEGSAGGGLASWAVISGYGTRDAIGGNLHATNLSLPAYQFRSYGGSVGLFDRLELSYARQDFDTGATGAKLGLGRGFTFNQDVAGLKLKVAGDAVYDQDSWLPQIAIGAQYKHNDRAAIIHAVGGKDDSGVDYYVAATKILLDQSLVLDATVRATRANQMGLLGFGGDKNNAYGAEFEGSAGYLVTRKLVVGAEYRTMPDNLGFAKQDNWLDLFAAYALNKHLSLTVAYADLGAIATFQHQRGAYVSLQAGF